jgi:hypothetical protein
MRTVALGKPRSRWVGNIKMNFKGLGWEELINLALVNVVLHE